MFVGVADAMTLSLQSQLLYLVRCMARASRTELVVLHMELQQLMWDHLWERRLGQQGQQLASTKFHDEPRWRCTHVIAANATIAANARMF